MDINPYPMTKMAQAIHMITRYSPVRVTTIPERAEKSAAPRENGSILEVRKMSHVVSAQYGVDGLSHSLDTGTRSRGPENLEVKWKIEGAYSEATVSEDGWSRQKTHVVPTKNVIACKSVEVRIRAVVRVLGKKDRIRTEGTMSQL